MLALMAAVPQQLGDVGAEVAGAEGGVEDGRHEMRELALALPADADARKRARTAAARAAAIEAKRQRRDEKLSAKFQGFQGDISSKPGTGPKSRRL